MSFRTLDVRAEAGPVREQPTRVLGETLLHPRARSPARSSGRPFAATRVRRRLRIVGRRIVRTLDVRAEAGPAGEQPNIQCSGKRCSIRQLNRLRARAGARSRPPACGAGCGSSAGESSARWMSAPRRVSAANSPLECSAKRCSILELNRLRARAAARSRPPARGAGCEWSAGESSARWMSAPRRVLSANSPLKCSAKRCSIRELNRLRARAGARSRPPACGAQRT